MKGSGGIYNFYEKSTFNPSHRPIAKKDFIIIVFQLSSRKFTQKDIEEFIETEQEKDLTGKIKTGIINIGSRKCTYRLYVNDIG